MHKDESDTHSFISTTQIGLDIAFKLYGKRAIYTNTSGVEMAYIPTKDVDTFRELVKEQTPTTKFPELEKLVKFKTKWHSHLFEGHYLYIFNGNHEEVLRFKPCGCSILFPPEDILYWYYP
jgi:hypothetical protein